MTGCDSLSRLAGYRAAFARMGFGDDEVSGLADRLVDQVAAR